MVTLIIFQDQIMGAKSSVYRMSLIDKACKVNVNINKDTNFSSHDLIEDDFSKIT